MTLVVAVFTALCGICFGVSPATKNEGAVSLFQQEVKIRAVPDNGIAPVQMVLPIYSVTKAPSRPPPSVPTPPPKHRQPVQSNMTVSVDITQDPHFNPLPLGITEDSLDTLSKFMLQEIRQMQDQLAELVQENDGLRKQLEDNQFDIQNQIMNLQARSSETEKLMSQCKMDEKKYETDIGHLQHRVEILSGDRPPPKARLSPGNGVTQDYNDVVETGDWHLRPIVPDVFVPLR